MTWGPQATGGIAPPVVVRRGGGGLWALPILWLLTYPLWLLWLFVAAIPPATSCPDIDVPVYEDCPPNTGGAAVADQVSTLITVLIAVLLVTCLIAGLIGLANGRRRTGILHGRTGLMVFTILVSAPHFVAYLAGYGLGQLRRAGRKTDRIDSVPAAVAVTTQAERFVAAPDTMAAITDTITAQTGKLPGAVLGWSLDGQDALVTAAPRGGVLVLGPPGSGKTSAVLIPTVLIAPGACVSSSIKSDVMLATFHARARRGRVWHFDPGGDEVTPVGVQRVHWSPLVSVRSWDDALQVGKTMAEPLTKGDTTTGGTHFVGRATDWVQTLLYAAHLDQRPIAAVARWAMAAADEDSQTEVLTILDTAGTQGDEGAVIAGQKLLGLISTPERERGSIISTMVALLRVYDSVSARKIGEAPNFDPAVFVRSTDTLYITARPDKQALYAPLLAALLEQIRFETYDRTKREQAGLEAPHPHVTFSLDEANTTAPIPLPAIISEAGGQGLHITVGIQALGPAIARWGDAAKSFLTLFPTKVIFRGVFDHDTVSALSAASGEYDRQMTGYSVSTSYVGQYLIPVQTTSPSYSTHRQKVLTEGDITAIPQGTALIWDGPTWGLLGIGMHWQSGVWQAVTQQAQHAAIAP
jgi:type IV secretion system protein VirD4